MFQASVRNLPILIDANSKGKILLIVGIQMLRLYAIRWWN